MKVNRVESRGGGVVEVLLRRGEGRWCEAQGLWCFEHRFSLFFFFFFFSQPVFCYKGSKSSSVRPEPRLESLNPDALQSRVRAIHLLI